VELLPVAELEVLHFLRERSFGHGLVSDDRGMTLPLRGTGIAWQRGTKSRPAPWEDI
jgi:hypothetical protein